MQLPSLPVAAAAALALSACGDRASENVEAGPAAANEVAAPRAPQPAVVNEAAPAPGEESTAPKARSRPDRASTPPPPPPPPPRPPAPRVEEPVVDPHAGHDMNDMDHD